MEVSWPRQSARLYPGFTNPNHSSSQSHSYRPLAALSTTRRPSFPNRSMVRFLLFVGFSSAKVAANSASASQFMSLGRSPRAATCTPVWTRGPQQC